MLERLRSSLSLFKRNHSLESLPPLDKITQIKGIVNDSSEIWFKYQGEKANRRYKAESERLLGVLTPEVIEDPNLYQQLSVREHIRVLELLKTKVPTEPEKLNSFIEIEDPNSEHKVISGYIVGLVENRRIFQSEEKDKLSLDSEEETFAYLQRKSNIDGIYIHKIMESRRRAQVSNILKGSNGHLNVDLIPSLTNQQR